MTTHLASMTPKNFRLLVSSGKFKSPTSGVCSNFKQANVILLEKKLAERFKKISIRNYGPLPILKEVENGAFDVLQCLPGFIEVGKANDKSQEASQMPSMQEINSKYTAFLIGCSFSFEGLLLENKIPVRNLEQNCNVSMYKTGISLSGLEDLDSCQMVVSMRPIPKSNLKQVFNLTSSKALTNCHGPPIGFGKEFARKILKINSLENVDYGDKIEYNENEDVPVFWCCGVTLLNLAESFIKFGMNELPIYTHKPGHMYVMDNFVEKPLQEELEGFDKQTELYGWDNHGTNHGSFMPVKKSSLDRIEKINKIIKTHDPGQRGIKNFIEPDSIDFSKRPTIELETVHLDDPDIFANFLSWFPHLSSLCFQLINSKNILLLTGFPAITNPNHKTPYENDGPQGIAALAKKLVQLFGYRIENLVIFCDELSGESQGAFYENVLSEFISAGKLKIQIGNPESLFNENDKNFCGFYFDTILTSERAAVNRQNKKYCNMRMQPLDIKYLDDINQLIIDNWAGSSTNCNDPSYKIISIGDGGNEFGMEKSKDISEMCNIHGSCDYLIAAGVSNWACYAFIKTFEIFFKDEIAKRFLNHGIFTGQLDEASQPGMEFLNYEEQFDILKICEDFDLKSGMDFTKDLNVDGMFFENEHKELIEMINNV